MRKSICILSVFTSLLTAHSVDARSVCLKAYGGTPAEALRAGAELLENANFETEKSNIQVRILPKKEKGLFVAGVSSVHDQGICGFWTNLKKDKAVRQKCNETICSI